MIFKSGDTNCVLQKQELCTVKYSDVYRIIRKLCTVEFRYCVPLVWWGVYWYLPTVVPPLYQRYWYLCTCTYLPLYLYISSAVPVHIYRRTCIHLHIH